MILLHEIIHIFYLANDDRRAVLLVVCPDGRGIGLAPINGDHLGYPMAVDGLGQEAYGRPLVPVSGQEEINRLATLVHRAIEIAPFPFDADVGLVQAPTDPDRSLLAVKRRFQWGTVRDDPSVDGGVID